MNEGKRERRAFLISFCGNVLLFLLKLISGIIVGSALLKADAVHSLADIAVTIISFSGDLLSKRKKTPKFPYGYVKIANFTALLSAFALIVTAVMLFLSGESQSSGGGELTTVLVCVFVVIIKQILFFAVLKSAKAARSEILKADAWHHQADSLSSVAALVGSLFIAAAFEAGEFICRLIISFLIIFVAVKILVSAFLSLVDYHAGKEIELQIRDFIAAKNNVSKVLLKTRRAGNGCFVTIYVQSSICCVSELKALFLEISKEVEARFPFVYEAEVAIL